MASILCIYAIVSKLYSKGAHKVNFRFYLASKILYFERGEKNCMHLQRVDTQVQYTGHWEPQNKHKIQIHYNYKQFDKNSNNGNIFILI